MDRKIISHYRILEKLDEGVMSQNRPRTLFVSGCGFADPAEVKREV
jgi:hypothetical protein